MNQITTTPLDSNHLRASLAAELAVGLLPLPDILKRFDMTSEQLRQLLKVPEFRGMVSQYKREWHEAANAKERIRLKAAVMVEENLIELHRIFNDIELNPTARMDAFKQMTNLADVQPSKDASASGPRFNLTLNLGNDSPVTIDAEAIENK